MKLVPCEAGVEATQGIGHAEWESLLTGLRLDMLRCLRARHVEHHLAEDVVQESLGIVWRKLEQVRQPERLESWARSVVLNRLRTHLSRQRPVQPVADDLPAFDEPLTVLLRRERSDLVDGLMSTLRPEERLPVALRHAAGLSPEATCALLGISRPLLRRRLHASLERLRRHAGIRFHRQPMPSLVAFL
jgi:RNA polymerase sigma-70 factor (ECF subfamily)